MVYRIVHALPNSWLPTPANHLVITGISAAELKTRLAGKDVISHVRYDDHAQRISAELGINLPASGENAPSPFGCNDCLVVASATPGSTKIGYVLVWNGTAALNEAGIIS